MNPIKFYTLNEVAEILQLTPRTIQSYVKDKKIRAIKFGRVWRISDEDLRTFVEARANMEQAEPEGQADIEQVEGEE